jgi:hypothetical protein
MSDAQPKYLSKIANNSKWTPHEKVAKWVRRTAPIIEHALMTAI